MAEGTAPGLWLLDAPVPGAVEHIVLGRFRQPNSTDVALVSSRHVQLLADCGRRRMSLACVTPVHAHVRDARTLPCRQHDQVGNGCLLL